jgi:hypothetical protein
VEASSTIFLLNEFRRPTGEMTLAQVDEELEHLIRQPRTNAIEARLLALRIAKRRRTAG